MQIIGVDEVVFGVEVLDDARQFCTDFGFVEVESAENGAIFETLDGCRINLRRHDDPALPGANVAGPTSRLTIWGVKDQAALDEIARELETDRPVQRLADGALQTVDDENMAIAFRISRRRRFEPPMPMVNGSGAARQRPVNHRVDFKKRGQPHSIGHVVFWSPDPDRSMKFYVDRLGFRITDQVRNKQGVFARAKGSPYHHNIFFLGRPDSKPSFQHIEFHFTDLQEVMLGGQHMSGKGWKTAFGPGRHQLGSSWYWYFQSPMGGAFELGSDFDQVDDDLEVGHWDNLAEVAGFSLDFLPARAPSQARK